MLVMPRASFARVALALYWLAALGSGSARAHATELTLPGYQTETGAITVQFQGDSVDPYFAAKALLAARDTGLDGRGAAEAWIDWALRHQRRTGHFDRYCRNGTEFETCAPADADDSAFALWIELLIRFEPTGGMSRERRASLNRAIDQLQLLHDSRLGVYRISSRQPVALLMDNIEVYSALRSLAEYYERNGDSGRAQHWRERAKALQVAILKVFQGADGQFRASTQTRRTASFYPDGVVQLFPLLADMVLADSEPRATYAAWLSRNRGDWFAMRDTDFPWGLMALAARKVGDENTVSCWRAHVAPFRHGKHWNVLEEAIFIGLAGGDLSVPPPPCRSFQE